MQRATFQTIMRQPNQGHSKKESNIQLIFEQLEVFLCSREVKVPSEEILYKDTTDTD